MPQCCLAAVRATSIDMQASVTNFGRASAFDVHVCIDVTPFALQSWLLGSCNVAAVTGLLTRISQ